MAATSEIYLPASSPHIVEDDLVDEISRVLNAGQRVLWLLSGGSAIPIAAAVAGRLDPAQTKGLTVMQVDERYGPVGHKGSNWQALLDGGFSCPGATCTPMLQGLPFEETITSYEQALSLALTETTMRIGLFGIGADGHTAGMLPGSTAASEQRHLAAGYRGADYLRITMTTPAIAQLDLAIAYVSGPTKLDALTKLVRFDLAISEQPAQALKRAECMRIYSDNFPLSLS